MRISNSVLVRFFSFLMALSLFSAVFFGFDSKAAESELAWHTVTRTFEFTKSSSISSQVFDYTGSGAYNMRFNFSRIDFSSLFSDLFVEGQYYIIDNVKSSLYNPSVISSDVTFTNGSGTLGTAFHNGFTTSAITYTVGSAFPLTLNVYHNVSTYPEDFGSFHVVSGSLTASYSLRIKLVYASVSKDRFESYSEGYASGFSDGYDEGYNAGSEDGYNVGFDSGYDKGFNLGVSSGYDEGYTAGYDQGYSSGASDGYDEGYDAGYDQGVDSVDTDSFYSAGFEAGESVGYSEGYEVGYDAAYESAYEQGYNQAVENLTGSGVVQNQSTHINKSLSLNNNSLDIEDVNTLLPVVYNEWYDVEYEYLSSFTSAYISLYGDDFDGDGIYDNWASNPSGGTFSSTDITSLDRLHNGLVGLGYYVGCVQKLFTASTDAYAYKVYIKQKDVDYTRSNVWKAWNIVGTHSDVLEGSADLGSRFYQGSSLEHTFFIYTDNLPVDIYSAALIYFWDDHASSASIDLTADLSITFTPYTRTEYNQIIESVNNLGGKIDDLGDDLMHGYDSSAGSATNTQLKGSVDSYGSMENTLFDSVSGGLSDYEFFDFSSVPAMITGLSFIGSIFLSWFNAAGGASGVGIVLSVLFSVMLVSMALGLYRHYQSRGKKGG